MNTRQIIVIFCLFAVFFSALSIASASDDDVYNMTVSVANDENTIDVANDNDDVLQDPPGSFLELEAEVMLVPEEGTLQLEKDYSYSGAGHTIDIDRDMTIDGQGHTLNAGGQTAIFNIKGNSHVILKDILFANGHGDDGGAVKVNSGSSVEIIDCNFSNNTATNFGGAIYIVADNADIVSKITNSIFDNNTAYNGGAIYINSDKATIADATFTSNGAANDGAALYVAGNYCNLANSTFTDNAAGDDGPAVYWQGSNGTIYNITCLRNKGVSGIDPRDGTRSSSKGGTICLTGSNVNIIKSSFADSYAGYDGGALFITGNNDNVIDCQFDNCTSADTSGGALYIIGNYTNILNCDFENCNANLSGGVIYVIGHDVTIDHTTFTGNGANLDGAALFVEGDNCSLANSTFTDNVAGDDGGAVYWEGDNGIIYNITCVNNKGISGIDPVDKTQSNSKGGTICLTGSNVTIDKSSFTQSSAVVDGGALFITGNNVNLLNSEFSDCTSTDGSGGALYIIGNYTDVLNCTFNDCEVNTASDHRGGAIYVAGNNASIEESSFTHTHGLVGGAIFIEGDDTVVDKSKFRYNDASGPTPSAGGTGGAINVNGAGATISNSDFAHTTAVNYGGAISVWGPNTVIVNNTFEDASTSVLNGGTIFVYGENTTIADSNFTKSRAVGDQFAHGGAIDVQGDNSKILNCNFDDCESYFGGIINVNGVNSLINASTFKNSKANQGGAVYVDGVHTTISNSNFTDISSENYGGAIFVAGSETNISESNFLRCNVAKYHGGAIYIAGENTNIENSNFTLCKALNNKVETLGGAIAIENGPNTLIKSSNFVECDAVDGGCVYVFGNLARIEDSTFNSSTAKYGGAIYLGSWGASIKGCNFTKEEASENGGAIYVFGGGANIVESNFDECEAKGSSIINGGGAIYIEGPDTNIANSNFNHNMVSTGAYGGTIYIKGERTHIDGSNFNDSSAKQGGLIFIEGEQAVIKSSSFANSSSSEMGGAIAVYGHDATIDGASFEHIKASHNGGAIYVDGENTYILHSSFDDCVATGSHSGGAIYIYDIKTTVAYSNFTSCHADTAGAIAINGTYASIGYCNLNNNTAGSAGAIKVFGNHTILSNCNFTYNKATIKSGGALDIGGSNASVYYSWFDHNDAKSNGGAINWIGGHGDDSIIGSTFTNNDCHDTTSGGGAIFWTAGDENNIGSGGLILDSVFVNNTSHGHHGGAIDWYHAIDSTINNCLFVNNTASSDGGALYTGDRGGHGHHLMMSNCQFYNNYAGKHGGAIANQMSDSWVYNNTFDGNGAKASGGTILMKEGPAVNSVIDHCYIYNSYIDQNYDNQKQYGVGGAAIRIGDANITISNCAIINSTANKTHGGAISADAGSAGSSLINVSIQNAKVLDGYGGAISWNANNGIFNNVTIFDSSASLVNDVRAYAFDDGKSAKGGAIFLGATNCQLNDIKIFKSSSNNNNATAVSTNEGGAIYVKGNGNTLTNVTIDDSSALSVNMNANGGAIYWAGTSGTLINATISNTLANGQGGAIYFARDCTVKNISIEYSQTNVINSAKSADGGAIYANGVSELNNVTILDALASKDAGDVYGGAIYYNGKTLNNVTVIGSRAVTGNGTSYGGGVYWKKGSVSTVYIYDSLFDENNANLGGGLYATDITVNVENTQFIGNVADDGGALYGIKGDDILKNTSFTLNSAKRGGAIFADNVQVKIDDSSLTNNTAEEKGGAIYHYNVNLPSYRKGYIQNSNLTNNTAFQGSAIYSHRLVNFSLKDVILLDNQANSKEFIEKAVGVDETGKNYTSGVFVGYDNLLNAIWQEQNSALSCTNVTYWGVDGKTVANSAPVQSDREVNINVTVEMFNEYGEFINETPVVTDDSGRFKMYFKAEEGKTYYFAFRHDVDRYYTYLRDTLSNSSLVKIYVNDPIYYSQNQTIRISLTDGAWGELNGTVTVTLNDTNHTTFTFEVVNGTFVKENISGLIPGHYNATAKFDGDANHTADSDWTVFTVLPYYDLEIKKNVNITADFVNVTDIIKYTINVTNHGPTLAWNVNVTEVLSPYLKLMENKTSRGYYNLTNGTWFIGDMDVNETVNMTIIAQIIHMGPITNTVWVKGEGVDINITNDMDSARNFTALPILDLRIVKEVNVTAKVINVLDIIKFNITVFNDGPCNATGVVVGEVLDYHLRMISNSTTAGNYSEGTWNIGHLANGTNATLTIVAQVIYSGNVSNAVNVKGFENETNYKNNNATIKNITAIANVDLKIKKEVNVTTGFVNVTDRIKFVLTVTNTGPCNASGVVVTEPLDIVHLKMVSWNATRGIYRDNYTWVIGNLNKGETLNLTIIADVIRAGNITNAVVIGSDDNDTNKSNNNDSIKNITALNIVDLQINKTVNVQSGFVNVSDTIIFTITVRNKGPCDATGVNVTEVLSPHLRMKDNQTWGSYYNVTEGVWHIGDLIKGDWRELIITAEVISAGNITNVVVVTSNENDTNKSNNNDSIKNITALDLVDLKITKKVNVTTGFVNVSDKIRFIIEVFNNGPSNATNVNVTEVLDSHLKLDGNYTENGYYNVTDGVWYIGDLKNQSRAVLTIDVIVKTNGTIFNVVTVNSTENESDPSDNTNQTPPITALPIVDLVIKKVVNLSSTNVEVMDIIKFTVTVTNRGPSNATGVYVSEPLDLVHLKVLRYNVTKGEYKNNYTWTIGNMANGTNETLTIVAQVIYSGIIENAVVVNVTEYDTNITNNKDNITPLNASAHVDLGIFKKVNVTTGVVNVGDLIEFNLVAYNNGPCNATGVYVLEPLDNHLELVDWNATKGEYLNRYTWNIGNLNKGEIVRLKIIARVSSPGIIANAVHIDGYDNDSDLSNNNDSIKNITALPIVDVYVNKTVEVSVVNVSDEIEYRINVINRGPCVATDINITEHLSPLVEFVSARTWIGTYNNSTNVWHIPELEVKVPVYLVLTVKVKANGTIENFVTMTSKENDTNKSNNNYTSDNVTALPVVDVKITKTVNVTVVNVTDKVKFTITVKNDGPSNATGVNMTDKLDSRLKFVSFDSSRAGITYNNVTGECIIGDLKVNESVVLIIEAKVMVNGSIGNIASVVSVEKDTKKSNNNDSSQNITALPIFDLRINKTCNVTSVNVGGLIEFTVVVFNDGPCNATGVYVSEPLDNRLDLVDYNATKGEYLNRYTWNIGNLANGTNATLTIVARVNSAGNISNFVTVFPENDTNRSNNHDNVTNITALPVVDLYINKTVEVTKVNVYDSIDYTINVINRGLSTATDINVTEHLSPLVEFVSARTWIGTYNNSTNVWHIPELEPNVPVYLVLRVKVMTNGTVENFVAVTSAENDTNKSNDNYTSDNVTALPVVDLCVNKTVNVTVVNVTDKVKYTIVVKNKGPSNATGVGIVDKLDSRLKFVSFDSSRAGITYNNATGIAIIGNLDVNESVVLTIVARVMAVGEIPNMVNVTSRQNDTNISNNKNSSDNVTGLPVVDLCVNKTVNVTVVNVTGKVKYTIVVKNKGPSNATDVVVGDKLDSRLKFVSFDSSRAGITYNNVTGKAFIGDLDVNESVVLTIVARVMVVGEIPNMVNVTGRENDTDPSNDKNSSDNVTGLPVVDLCVNKTVNVTVVNVTGKVKYTIVVKNNGPSNATGVNVTDKLDSHLKFVSFDSSRAGITYNNQTGTAIIGNLSVNETVVLTIVAKVVSNGTIANVAVANSTENDTDPSNNTGSSDNVTALPIVNVKINKTVSVSEVKIGDTFTYIITVHNYGPSNATNVNVREKLSDYITLVNSTASKGSYNVLQNNWYIGGLKNNETATLTLLVKVVSKGIIENVVFVNSTENDTDPSDNNYTCDNVTVLDLNTPIELDCYDIYYGDDEIITVTLPTGATGTVNITVGDRHYDNVEIDKGKVKLPVSDLGGGDYNVTVNYGGDGIYAPNSTSGKFTVYPVVPIITIEVEDIWVGEIEVVNVTVNAPGVVYVTVYNITVEISLENGVVTTDVLSAAKNEYHGNATWNIIGLPVGAYPAFALYPGNENYTSVNTSDLFHVRDKPSTVNVTAEDIYVGEDAVINIKVGPEGVSGNVTVTLEGKKYILPIDENGEATLVVSGLKAGLKHVKVEYNGTIVYRPSENSTTFNVLKLKPPVDVFAPDITVGEDGVITVTVPEDATGTITLEIEGKRYKAEIEDGKAIFIIPGLKVGIHDIKVYYSGDDKYLPANTTGSIKVKPDNNESVIIKAPVEPKKSTIENKMYSTGNPIIALIVVLLSLSFVPLRRFKK